MVGQSFLERIVLSVKPIGKSGSDFVNLGIRHLYGFHIPHLNVFAIYLYCFRNIGRGIDQGVFDQGNSVIRPALGFDRIFIPDMYVLLFAGDGKVIGTIGVMDTDFCIEKMRRKPGINACGYPAFAEIKIEFLKFDTSWSCFL